MRIGIGISDHTGWAVLFAVGGDARRPDVLLRRRLQLVDPQLPRQVYHAIAEEGRPRTLVREVVASVDRECRRELEAALADLDVTGGDAGIAIPGVPGA